MQAQIRKDYVRDQYVIVTPGLAPLMRSSRQIRALAAPCSLCSPALETIEPLYRFPDYGQWYIGVLPNKHHATFLENAHHYGTQETIVEVPEHSLHLEDLPQEHIARIFDAYAARVEAFTKDKKIQHVTMFKNAGGPTSQMHAYSQIYGASTIPERIKEDRARIDAYRKASGRCIFCDIAKQERKSDRLIYEDAFVTVFAPYASASRYEAWIMPRRHLHGIEAFSGDERHSIAGAIKHLFQKIVKLCLPSHFSLEQTLHDTNQHVYMVVSPRDQRALRTQSGIIVNPVSPESAAEYYRW